MLPELTLSFVRFQHFNLISISTMVLQNTSTLSWECLKRRKNLASAILRFKTWVPMEAFSCHHGPAVDFAFSLVSSLNLEKHKKQFDPALCKGENKSLSTSSWELDMTSVVAIVVDLRRLHDGNWLRLQFSETAWAQQGLYKNRVWTAKNM